MRPDEVAKIAVSATAVVGVAAALLAVRADGILLALAAAVVAAAAFTAFTAWADAGREDKRWRVSGGVSLTLLVVLAVAFATVLTRYLGGPGGPGGSGGPGGPQEMETTDSGGFVEVDLNAPKSKSTHKSTRTSTKMSPKQRRAYDALFAKMEE